MPTLHCPAQSEIVLISKAEGKSVNMSDYINVTFNGNYNVTFSPTKFVTFDHNTIGVYTLRKLPPCHSQTSVTLRWSVSLV
jgi:hypothetical protein